MHTPIAELDQKTAELQQDAPREEVQLRLEISKQLQTEVEAMNVNNFVVRPQRRLVEKYAKAEAWKDLGQEAQQELAHHIAGLPTQLESEDEEAKRFDLLMLNLQLAVLRSEPAFQRLKEQVVMIAGLLEEKSSIPMVKAQMVHIQEIQTDEWWDGITVPMLEQTRKKLRSLVKLIEKAQRKPIYTDFDDEMGPETAIELSVFASAGQFEQFRAKARAFLKSHESHLTVQKLRLNEPLTASDLKVLESMLAESGVGTPADVEKAKAESHGLGLFVRSLVGLDREAAKKAFAQFLTGKTLGANQIEFVNMVIGVCSWLQ